MKFTYLRNPDSVHATIEKMTNPVLPFREATEVKKTMSVMITEKTSDIISHFSTGSNAGRPKKGEKRGYNKQELLAMLLTAYCKNYQKSSTDAQAKELQELRKICIDILPETRQKTGSEIAKFKLTKRLIAAAILHRVISTQDVKEFFSKML